MNPLVLKVFKEMINAKIIQDEETPRGLSPYWEKLLDQHSPL
jgi:hypothetical protein